MRWGGVRRGGVGWGGVGWGRVGWGGVGENVWSIMWGNWSGTGHD